MNINSRAHRHSNSSNDPTSVPSHTQTNPISNNHTTLPTVPRTCAHRNIQLPFKYLEFIPSNTIIDQLLHLNDEELTILLLDGPSSAADIVCHILEADLALDGIMNLTTDNEQDPPTMCHAQCSKYWNEWLAVMHKELEALKAKDVYKEVKELPLGRKAVKCKWVL